MAYTLKDFEDYLRKINHGKYDNMESNIYPATAPKTPTYSDTVRPWDVENKENTFYANEENSGTMGANQQLGVGDKTSVGNVAAPMSAPGAGANADPYAITWTPEQKMRKQLNDAQIMRDNLLANNVGGMPTTEDVVKLGEYDAQIKQLTQELGLGQKEYTPGVEGGDIGDGNNGYSSVKNIAAPMSAPEPEQNASEAGSGSNGAVATQSNSDATGQGVVAARSNSGGSKDRYINPDDYENSEDYAKAILEGVRNSIDAQDLDNYLTANGYAAGAEGLAALNKYVEDVLGALGVAVYTDELNAKEEETSGANGQPASSEPQEQAASSEPQAAQPASSDVPEYELYSPVEPELTPVEQIQQARWDALNRPFEQMGVTLPEWTSPENGGNGVGTDVPDDYYIKPSGYTDEDYAKELFKQLYLHNQDGTGDAFLMANGFEAGDEGKQALINDVQDRLGIENVVAYWEALNEVYGEDATQHVISAPQDDSIVPVAGGLYYNTETGEHVDNYNYEGNAENEEDSGDDNSNVNSNVNSQVEISINQIDDIMHEMFSDTYIQGSVALSDSFDPKTIEISEVAAALFNIGRGAILDLPFYLYGNALLGATKLFKVGKHATSATKTAANIMKYGASYIVGNIGSSILEEIVDMPEILKGKTTTYVVNAEFQEGNKVFQVDVNENGRIVVTYFNPR